MLYLLQLSTARVVCRARCLQIEFGSDLKIVSFLIKEVIKGETSLAALKRNVDEQPECYFKLNEIRLETIHGMGANMLAVMCEPTSFSIHTYEHFV